jgi:hypothetical protein
MQNRLWTADSVKTRWLGQPICQLCCSQHESALHMLVHCSYSKMVWAVLATWFGTSLQSPPSTSLGRPKHWWSNMIHLGTNSHMDEQVWLQKLIYIAWNIWKQRCRRIFDKRHWHMEPFIYSSSRTYNNGIWSGTSSKGRSRAVVAPVLRFY